MKSMIYGKIWELILILALVGMMFILQLDHKNNMEKWKQDKTNSEIKDKTDIAESKNILEFVCYPRDNYVAFGRTYFITMEFV